MAHLNKTRVGESRLLNCSERIVTHELADCNKIIIIVTHKLLGCNEMIVTHKLLDCNEMVVTQQLLDCNAIILTQNYWIVIRGL